MKDDPRPFRSAPQRAIAAAATPILAQSATALWPLTSAPPEPIAAVQNFVYAIELAEGPAILRLTHESHRDPAEVKAELRWMIDLEERGLPVPVVYRSARGALFEEVESGHGRFVVSCFQRLSGVKPDPLKPERWNERMWEDLGAIMARLHQASYEAAWTPANLPRRGWREESVAQDFHFYVPVGEKAVHEAFDRVLAKLDSLPRSRECFGLIHADLNDANFFLAPNELKIFDFDDSCFCWFAYDLIVPIFHLPVAEPEVTEARARDTLRSLLRGYERVRRFPRPWLEWLPLLFKWRDLLTYGFFYQQLEVAALPEGMRRAFLAMRARIEGDRPIAEIDPAG